LLFSIRDLIVSGLKKCFRVFMMVNVLI
jgi:hypothetical protein